MSDRIHVVQLDAPMNELAVDQARAAGVSRTRFLETLLSKIAADASPVQRELVQTKVLVPDEVWEAVSEHARSRGRNVSAVLADALLTPLGDGGVA